MDANTHKLSQAYIAFANSEEDSPEYEKNFWAFERFCDLSSSDPESALNSILAVLRCQPGKKVIQLLAAGPLEELLENYGEAIIDVIEGEAKRNPAFAHLLGGVWKGEISDSVWQRVESVCSGKW